MLDEEEPIRRPPRLTKPDLASWSVGELHDYIAELRAEIGRAEQAIAGKTQHRSAADAVFGRPAAPK